MEQAPQTDIGCLPESCRSKSSWLPGLVTVDLVTLVASQRALIGALDRERSAKLMGALDACNAKHGRGVVFPAAAGIARQRKAWITKFDMRSPRYETWIDELPVVEQA